MSQEDHHLLRKQFQQTSRRLQIAERALKDVRGKVPPTIRLVPAPGGTKSDLVVVVAEHEMQLEVVAVADDDEHEDDGDFAEGSDDEEDLVEALQEIGGASFGR